METLLEIFRSPDIQVALGINLLLAWSLYLTLVTGQLSLGHAAFMSVGAYAASIVTIKLGLPLALALTVATLAAGAVGLVAGFPALRLRGLYLAIASIGFVYLVQIALEHWEYAGGRLGISGMSGVGVGQVWTCVVAIGLVMALLEHSPLMLAFRAVRENADAAAAVGIPATPVRLLGFTLGAGLAGLAGGLWAHYILFIDPEQFQLQRSFDIVLFVVLGGVASYWGPVLGAVLMTLLPVWVRPVAEWREVVFAGILIAMMAFRPQGLVSGAFRMDLRRSRHGAQPGPAVPHPPAGAPLTASDLCKRFGGVVALQNVSFHIAPGEVLGIMGPNGAGKSTLLDCITGFTPLNAGTVRFGTRDITRLPAAAIAALGIRRTFQKGGLFLSLSARNNLRAGALRTLGRRGLLPVPLRADHADGVDQVAPTLPYGLQRRLEIARALAGRPAVLLVDEPAAGLNNAEADETAALLRSLVAGGMALVVVDHNVGFLLSLADRILVLEGGRVIAEGSPDAVIAHPRVIEAYLGVAGRSVAHAQR